MTPTALTATDGALATTDVMTAFGALLRLCVADGDASPETIEATTATLLNSWPSKMDFPGSVFWVDLPLPGAAPLSVLDA